MVNIPSVLPELEAGEIPGQIDAACKLCQVEPESLMDWCLKPDRAVIILPDGRKVTFPVVGKWINLPFPWLMDDGQERDSAVKHLPPVGSFELPADVPVFEEPGAAPRPEAPAKPAARRKK